MKIKTITCHNVYNTGASLQAYALAEYLHSLGHEVEIIDYCPEYLRHFRLWGVGNPIYDKPLLREAYCIAKLPLRLSSRLGRRKREFDRFTRDFLPVTKDAYPSNEALAAAPPQADVYFAGSDQIWNTFFQNGKDPAFYLDFVPEDSVRASYAASFATENIPEKWQPQLQCWINHLDYISVRESSGISLLRTLGIDRGVQVLDPVFLLTRNHWCSLATQWNNPEFEPYLLVYDFDNNPALAKFSQKIAEERRLRIVSVLDSPFFRYNYSQEGPTAFLSLILNASAVVSNSFHATAFSLIFEKEFWVFYRNEHINTRMRDLLTLAGLEQRIVDTVTVHPITPIPYDLVRQRIQRGQEQSTAYIHTVLEAAREQG